MRSIVSRCAALLSGAFLLMNSVPAAFAEEPNTIVQKEAHTMQTYRQMLTELAPELFLLRQEGVSYPTFQKYTYYSHTAHRDTPVNVLLPTDYDEQRTYPVLYILHGYWDTQDWMARDAVGLNVMLGNLWASGEAEEMIVVLPYIFCDQELRSCTGMNLRNSLCYDNFVNDLTADLMPFIQQNFAAATGREQTAITGFSMGGRESLFIALTHPELFAWVGAVAPAPGLTPIPGSADHPGQLQESELTFGDTKPELLLISASRADGVVTSTPSGYRQVLQLNGEELVWHQLTNTQHDHTSVKPHLYNFCRMIFRRE